MHESLIFLIFSVFLSFVGCVKKKKEGSELFMESYWKGREEERERDRSMTKRSTTTITTYNNSKPKQDQHQNGRLFNGIEQRTEQHAPGKPKPTHQL